MSRDFKKDAVVVVENGLDIEEEYRILAVSLNFETSVLVYFILNPIDSV